MHHIIYDTEIERWKKQCAQMEKEYKSGAM